MHDERRKFQRRSLLYYSPVSDRLTDRVIGYIVDLTPEGAMIISEEPVEPLLSFRLRMDLPEDIPDKSFIDFEAQCVWCRKDMDPHYWGCGFHLSSIPDEDLHLIERVIAQYGFQDD